MDRSPTLCDQKQERDKKRKADKELRARLLQEAEDDNATPKKRERTQSGRFTEAELLEQCIDKWFSKDLTAAEMGHKVDGENLRVHLTSLRRTGARVTQSRAAELIKKYSLARRPNPLLGCDPTDL